MIISKPILQPKTGYVEVEVNGIRTYRNVETGRLIIDEEKNTTPTEMDKLEAQVTYTAMMTDTLLEV